MLIYTYICSCRIHTDAMNNDEQRLHSKNMYLSFYCNVCVRGSWRPNKDCNILTPLLWPSALCLSRSLDAQPEDRGLSFLLSAGFLYHNLSATSLNPNQPWPRAPSAWCGFPYHFSSNSVRPLTPTV